MTDRRSTDEELRVTHEDLVALVDEGLGREFSRLIAADWRLDTQGQDPVQELGRPTPHWEAATD